MPQYFVVNAFFDHAIAKRRDQSPGRYARLLDDLGIVTGSEAEKRLDLAITEAEAVRAIPTVDPDLDNEEEYWNFQMKALREKARALGHVYATLLRDLRRLGVSDRRLETYLEERVRPNTSLQTAGEWPAEVLSAVRSFDDEIQAVSKGEEP